MGRLEPVGWTADDRNLWTRIAAHDFEPPGDVLTFTARLARDHGWSLVFARGAVDEYRRFCFLAVRSDFKVTPSEEVDEVWHQHLTFSRDYWQIWCHEVLRADLHHQPTRGGSKEGRRFADQYARTLALYEAWFGPPPPASWPGTAVRFSDRPRFRIVDRTEHLIVPVPSGFVKRLRRAAELSGLNALLSMLFVRSASAETLDVLDWAAVPFLTFYVAGAVASVVAARYLPLFLTSMPTHLPRESRLEPAELALLAGGAPRAADVMTLEAIAEGYASLEGRSIVIDGTMRSRGALARDLSGTVGALQDRLADQGLALSQLRHLVVRLATVGLTLPILGLGAARAVIGEARDKPVGILIFLLIVTGVIAMAMASQRRPASRAGNRVLERYRSENERAIRAPRPEEVIEAFAVAGAAALAGTVYDAYGELLKSDNGDGGSADGGCGGGGCGGCGGD